MHKTASDIISMKKSGEKIAVLTGYDYTMISICEAAGIDIILVGDSAGMVMMGYDSTVPVTVTQMCIFTEAASSARKNAMIVSDIPFMANMVGYTKSAISLFRAGADAVKIEGTGNLAEIRDIVDKRIPVMGHIGVQPQTAAQADGYKVQGTTAESARRLLDEARRLEEAGAFAIVLEMVAHEAASVITDALSIPTIGIGSGSGCDGQVLVVQDLLGIYEKIKPKFAKRYLELSGEIKGAVSQYVKDVKSGAFPESSHMFSMKEGELAKWNKR